MADDIENDDQWLYGDQPEINQDEAQEDQEYNEDVLLKSPPAPTDDLEAPIAPANENEKPPGVEETDDLEPNSSSAPISPSKANEENTENPEVEPTQNGNKNDEEEELDEDDDDDSDDDVNVVIGDIKTTPSYTSLNLKRGGNLLTSTSAPTDKSKQQIAPGKFSVDEFDQAGMINGVPATEYNLDSLEEKPWRKPGADITDYFNYGFNEDTWRAYCERQKRMRMTESGVGLAAQMTSNTRGTVPILNDNSKYSGNFLGIRKAGPPPGRRMTGSIDVIGGTAQRPPSAPVGKVDQPKMNVIQVMTADRREYSRKPAGFPDMSVPPPPAGSGGFDEFQPEYGFNPEPEPFYGGYEPTQDVQWGAAEPDPNWQGQPSEIKTLTAGPGIGPPPNQGNMPMGPPVIPMPVPSPRKDSPTPAQRSGSKDRERSRDVSRSRSERPRDRERSHRRERSRSRSRRHKSRSRSPSHRHRKKKSSRRHDESD